METDLNPHGADVGCGQRTAGPGLLVTPSLLWPGGITHEPGILGKLQARLPHDGHQDILVADGGDRREGDIRGARP